MGFRADLSKAQLEFENFVVPIFAEDTKSNGPACVVLVQSVRRMPMFGLPSSVATPRM